MDGLNTAMAALAGLVSILVVGVLCHISLVPARWTARDLWMIAPFALCVLAGRGIRDYGRRAVFGMAQAVLLLVVYSDHFKREISFGSVTTVWVTWFAWIVGYTLVFVVVTQVLGPRRRAYPPGYCAVCGYWLKGLVEARCPECGHAFVRNGAEEREGDGT